MPDGSIQTTIFRTLALYCIYSGLCGGTQDVVSVWATWFLSSSTAIGARTLFHASAAPVASIVFGGCIWWCCTKSSSDNTKRDEIV